MTDFAVVDPSELARLRRENADLRAHLAVHERLRHEAETASQRDARVMAWRRLYLAANDLAHVLGRDGEINTRHAATDAFMRALHDLDDGTFDRSIASGQVAP